MLLSFRLDKRPGESHLALDGKKDHIKRDPDGPDCLKAVHGGRLYDTHLVSSYDFREAARGFVVFVDTKVNAWGFLINEPDCLKNSVSLSSLHPRGLWSGAGYCHFFWVLWCTSLRQKAGGDFAGPTRWEPC